VYDDVLRLDFLYKDILFIAAEISSDVEIDFRDGTGVPVILVVVVVDIGTRRIGTWTCRVEDRALDFDLQRNRRGLWGVLLLECR